MKGNPHPQTDLHHHLVINLLRKLLVAGVIEPTTAGLQTASRPANFFYMVAAAGFEPATNSL